MQRFCGVVIMTMIVDAPVVRSRVSSSRMGPTCKRSIDVHGHHTSVAIERPFWNVIREAARAKGMTVNQFVSWAADNVPEGGNLSSTVRLAALAVVMERTRN